MFNITSNLDEVIAEMKAAEGAIRRQNVPAVINDKKYLGYIKDATRTLLSALTTEGEQGAIDPLVNTIAGLSAGKFMTFSMSGEAAGGSGKDLAKLSFEDMVRKWVEEQKEKTGRDTYKGGRGREPGEQQSNEAIAQRIIAISKHEPEVFFGDREHSENSLQSYIESASGLGGGEDSSGNVLTGLTDLRLSELLMNVLDFWQQEMGVLVQMESLAQIDAAFAVTKES